MSTPPSNGAWTIDDAGSLYNIGRWGAGYFGINPGGRVEVRPRQEAGAAVERLREAHGVHRLTASQVARVLSKRSDAGRRGP